MIYIFLNFANTFEFDTLKMPTVPHLKDFKEIIEFLQGNHRLGKSPCPPGLLST